MINVTEYVNLVVSIARQRGSIIETNRKGLPRINFGHKNLDVHHVAATYPDILQDDANIPAIINRVAPGRPCTHKPMRRIIEEIKKNHERSVSVA